MTETSFVSHSGKSLRDNVPRALSLFRTGRPKLFQKVAAPSPCMWIRNTANQWWVRSIGTKKHFVVAHHPDAWVVYYDTITEHHPIEGATRVLLCFIWARASRGQAGLAEESWREYKPEERQWEVIELTDVGEAESTGLRKWKKGLRTRKTQRCVKSGGAGRNGAIITKEGSPGRRGEVCCWRGRWWWLAII